MIMIIIIRRPFSQCPPKGVTTLGARLLQPLRADCPMSAANKNSRPAPMRKGRGHHAAA